MSRSELLKQNEALRQENQRLAPATDAGRRSRRGKRHGCGSFSAGNRQARWKLKLARVVLHDPANWWRTVQIDLGSRDGVRNNLPVLTPDGFLVGRISSVSLTRSQVVLLGDPNCKVVGAGRRTRRAIRDCLSAAGVFDGSLVELEFPSSNCQPESGPRRRDQRRRRTFFPKEFRSAKSSIRGPWNTGSTPKRASNWRPT